MKRLPIIASIMLLLVLAFPACEVENCPPNSMTYAHFTLVDQNGKTFKTSDTLTVIGQTYIQDSLVCDTFINKENGASSLQLPLSYNDETRFVIAYRSLDHRFVGTDTILIKHHNKPYFTNLDCGTMMFYTLTDVQYTHHRLDSLVMTNPNIDNNEKENIQIYFTVSTTDE
ncbi:DUF6452 family protein [uncultured Bacteroides sp.]|uniref:DUF6452 family protein n=1 Tax=uncultured Bacteroides sp. TaxID=162156 RepID=UPI00260B0DF2|nr:DUF6452 family protein [uncultured Bacteroides sp.]